MKDTKRVSPERWKDKKQNPHELIKNCCMKSSVEFLVHVDVHHYNSHGHNMSKILIICCIYMKTSFSPH